MTSGILDIEECEFRGNAASVVGGGAIFFTRTTAGFTTIRRSSFVANQAIGAGGAINVDTCNRWEMTGCNFDQNHGACARRGGRARARRLAPLPACTTGVRRAWALLHAHAPPRKNTNTAAMLTALYAGAVRMSGEVVPTSPDSNVYDISNCTFTGNEAQYGGALLAETSAIVAVRCGGAVGAVLMCGVRAQLMHAHTTIGSRARARAHE